MGKAFERFTYTVIILTAGIQNFITGMAVYHRDWTFAKPAVPVTLLIDALFIALMGVTIRDIISAEEAE